jgi:RNA-directed DNA polymerase
MRELNGIVGNLTDTIAHVGQPEWADLRSAWSHYFSYGAAASAYKHVDWHVYQRARDFLTRRHKVQGRGTARFSCEVVYGELGLIRL